MRSSRTSTFALVSAPCLENSEIKRNRSLRSLRARARHGLRCGMVEGVWHEGSADRDALSDGRDVRDEFLAFCIAFAVACRFEFEAERMEVLSESIMVLIRFESKFAERVYTSLYRLDTEFGIGSSKRTSARRGRTCRPCGQMNRARLPIESLSCLGTNR